MSSRTETAALVALMRAGGRPWTNYILEVRRAGGAHGVSAEVLLERELGLLAYQALADATEELQRWEASGYTLVTMVDRNYPENLRVVDNRPPLLFVAGQLTDADRRAVAVIGSRRPSADGLRLAADVASALSDAGYAVFSGLATGIDAAAHRAVLAGGGRTVAVIGTGLAHAYPREHAELQAQIARESAVVSQFWPESGPTRASFPARNALMSGLTLGSVIVEASEQSGTRVQARHALNQGRKLILMRVVMAQGWAQALVEKPGVTVAETSADVLAALRL